MSGFINKVRNKIRRAFRLTGYAAIMWIIMFVAVSGMGKASTTDSLIIATVAAVTFLVLITIKNRKKS